MVIQINPQSIASRSAPGLADLLRDARQGPGGLQASVSAQLQAARGPAARHAYIRLFEAEAMAQARALDADLAAGRPVGPLAGLVVSVKDLFDVAGHPATGGSVVLDGRHSALSGLPADQTPDAAAVARLKAAGAIVLGHGNLTEFAFSGVGINPHHGTPLNPVAALLDPLPRIPGGSSSGGAVALAAGACAAALGSDTGGSIRIPAALCGLVGFKCTASEVPLEGAIPLSTSLDTACALSTDVAGAVALHEVLAARTVARPVRTAASLRLAVPADVMLEALDPAVARAFEAALGQLSAAGARLETLRWPLLAEGAALQASLSFAAAESWAWHRLLLARDGARYDPRVASRIRRGDGALAADYLDLVRARRAWIHRMQGLLQPFDAALSPTVPLLAPPIAPLLTDDTVFFQTNAALLRNPSLINLLDGCAISLPCQAPGALPVGLMAWTAGGRDDALLAVASTLEASLAPSTGRP